MTALAQPTTTDWVPDKPWACPDGKLELRYDAPRTEWLKARRRFITSTDYAAIKGITHYNGAYGVWAEKHGLTPPDPTNQEQARGLYLEDGLAKWFRDHVVDYPIRLRRVGLMSSRRHPWLAASLDYRSVCPDGRCVTEIKTQGDATDWDGNEIPVHIQIQNQIQLLVTGADHVHTWALGPRLAPIERRMDRSAAMIASIVDGSRQWWEKYMVGDAVPAPDAASLETIQRMNGYVDPTKQPVEVGPEIARAVQQYKAVGAQIADLTEQRKDILALVTAAAGYAAELRFGGQKLCTLNTTKKIVGVNEDWRKARPGLAQEYTVTTTTIDTARLVADHPELITTGELRYERRLNVTK